MWFAEGFMKINYLYQCPLGRAGRQNFYSENSDDAGAHFFALCAHAVVLQADVRAVRHSPRGRGRSVGGVVSMGGVQSYLWGRSLLLRSPLWQPQVGHFADILKCSCYSYIRVFHSDPEISVLIGRKGVPRLSQCIIVSIVTAHSQEPYMADAPPNYNHNNERITKQRNNFISALWCKAYVTLSTYSIYGIYMEYFIVHTVF